MWENVRWCIRVNISFLTARNERYTAGINASFLTSIVQAISLRSDNKWRLLWTIKKKGACDCLRLVKSGWLNLFLVIQSITTKFGFITAVTFLIKKPCSSFPGINDDIYCKIVCISAYSDEFSSCRLPRFGRSPRARRIDISQTSGKRSLLFS